MPGLSRPKSNLELSSYAKKMRIGEASRVTGRLVPTSLYLPSANGGDEKERLYLPSQGGTETSESVDVYLSRIPNVQSGAKLLLEQESNQQEEAFIQKACSSRCMNVLQGEVAHASTLQADILVSAEATTCHVVALRSTRSKSSTVPLVSLAHVDQAGVYDNCLEAMVQQHLKHHKKTEVAGSANLINPEDSEDDEGFFFFDDDQQTGPQEPVVEEQPSFLPCGTPRNKSPRGFSSMSTLHDDGCEEPIEMELHMAGGYLDKEGTSQDISNSLLTSFSELASKYQDQVRISLKTALISSLNTTNANESSSAKPKSRGLGIDTQSGQVFPITSSLPPQLEGPGLEVRSARALARATSSPDLLETTESLHVIHDNTQDNGTINVQPYDYQAVPGLDALLHVPDDVLLKATSTSPECESDRFCTHLRRTVSFLNSSENIFQDGKRPLVFSRSAQDLTQWELQV